MGECGNTTTSQASTTMQYQITHGTPFPQEVVDKECTLVVAIEVVDKECTLVVAIKFHCP